MHCKPGDLAIVVNDYEYPANNGALMRIWKPAPPGEFEIPADWIGLPLSTFRFGDRTIEPGARAIVVYRDAELRPLRDTDEDDETIAWAGPRPAIPQEQLLAERGTAAQISRLRAKVEQVDRFVSGDWCLALVSGELGFEVRVKDTVMPVGGVKSGDSILLEYRKGGHPFLGPFTKVCVEHA